LWKMWSSKR